MKTTSLTVIAVLLAHCSLGQVTNLSNGNVGIGIPVPLAKLHVVIPVSTTDASGDPNAYGVVISDNSSSTLVIRSLGNGTIHLASDLQGRKLVFGGGNFEQTLSINSGGLVGIGTGSPAVPLEVNGEIRSHPTFGPANMTLFNSGINTGPRTIGSLSYATGTLLPQDFIRSSVMGSYDNITGINFLTNNGGPVTERMRIDNLGNVGIGTTGPLAMLHVNGNVLIGMPTTTDLYSPATYILDVKGSARADKLVVNTTGADFVFEPGYRLSPLAEVENFVQKNHRLPEIASATEMQKDGIEVGAQQAKLLQKLEEMTLYMIAQDKKQEAQNKKQERQEELILGQEKLLNQLRQKLDILEQNAKQPKKP